jgi:hypothetical protein
MARWWKRRKDPRPTEREHDARVRPPLREFVYLDDVSLRSLLASQKGELTEQVTDLLSQADEAELAGTVGASSPVLKAEVRSRYQTTTSHGSQTSRKAVVQSLFKELRELEGIDVALRPQAGLDRVASLEDLAASRLAVSSADLHRGTLVEIEVELAADPIFRFSTIASELTELAHDFPEMLSEPGARDGMAMLVPGNRFLQRFLAGLVPLRARATSHVVVDLDGADHVVPTSVAEALGLESWPLTVVGVTEQASYWRDVRRVLFSTSRFTMLCRVARDGLWDSWQPVKLAEVLKEVLPDFPDLITDVGRTGLSLPGGPARAPQELLSVALDAFITAVESAKAPGLTADGVAAARHVAAGTALELPMTATGQGEAFRLVIDQLREHGCTWTGDEWLEQERVARDQAGLVLFDQPRAPAAVSQPSGAKARVELLLDTEVIAIYW